MLWEVGVRLPVRPEQLDQRIKVFGIRFVRQLPAHERIAGVGELSDRVRALRHRLPPLLGERFRGCAAFVDLRGRKASDRASHTQVDPSLALSNMTVAANRAPVLNHHGKHNPTAEVADLLKIEAQFLVAPESFLKEATYRRSTL